MWSFGEGDRVYKSEELESRRLGYYAAAMGGVWGGGGHGDDPGGGVLRKRSARPAGSGDVEVVGKLV